MIPFHAAATTPEHLASHAMTFVAGMLFAGALWRLWRHLRRKFPF